MKKITSAIIVLFAAVNMASAQTVLSSAEYEKTAQPALMLTLPYNSEVSEKSILANLKKTGYDVETTGSLFWKKKQQDGFFVFKNVMLQGAATPVDLYFKVDGKKKDKQSTIYMLVNNSGTFIASDNSLFEPSKTFLNNFVEKSASYKLDIDIKNQEEVVKTNDRKLQKLLENEKDMNKKVLNLQDDIKKNKADQIKQQQLIDGEKLKLQNLRVSTTN